MIFKTAWHSGEVVPLAKLPVDMPWEPWGERGRGVFTTTRSFLEHRHIAFWPRHLDRLQKTLRRIELNPEQFTIPTENELVSWVESLGAGDVCLRINLMETASGKNEAWAVARPLPIMPSPTRLAFSSEPIDPNRGLKLVAQRWRRKAADVAAARGVWDVLDMTTDSRIVDGSRSNILFRIEGRWVIAWIEGSTLDGTVSTSLVEHNLAQRGVLSRLDIEAATEVVATNSVRGIVPIHEVEGRVFTPGDATKELQGWFEKAAVAHAM
jgi:branched-subunit amino acid aminotransferase/4-amino-4-deoxychorismate lyase